MSVRFWKMENPEIKSVDNFSRTPSRSSMLTKISKYYRLYLYIYIFVSNNKLVSRRISNGNISLHSNRMPTKNRYFFKQLFHYSMRFLFPSCCQFSFQSTRCTKSFWFSFIFHCLQTLRCVKSIESSQLKNENWQKLNEFRKFKLNLFSSAQYVFVWKIEME